MSVTPPLRYAESMRAAFPQLRSAALCADLDRRVLADVDLERWLRPARERLADRPESELEPIRAWRAVFARMGLKPTQYRCASEAVLRRLRTTGELPRIHPLVDLCNAVSAASALPIAAIDLDRVSGPIVVRPAAGDETYHSFSGAVEQPEPGEIVFADDEGRAHARRWTHRQSAWSAVSDRTTRVLVVCEGHHATARDDTLAALAEVGEVVGGRPTSL